MMSGKLYIDNVDVYARYGVFVVEGGYNELLAYPPLKTVTQNDWQEYDGVEADLSAPVLNTREITVRFAVRFAVRGASSLLFEFCAMLADGAYHVFRSTEIGRSFRLRLVQHTSFEAVSVLGFLSTKFADDYPLEDYEYEAPTGGGVAENDDYTIDGRPFTDYGVRILQGSLDEIRRGNSVKQALLRNITSQAGAIYDSGTDVTYKAKDVKLNCLLRADDLEEMWRNYYALLYDLIREDERTLYVKDLNADYPCYYRKCSVNQFSASGRIWLQFTLTLTITGNLRNEQREETT
ncbi:MAG: hypothetical protein MJY71_02410 [Bacteroidaceae bacterium]|nr:hypothetical protein [Bacteroidaceae bacterium]